ncbi:MAG: hypothetical protein PSV35_06560 [bacterium]|nr:hypothetical protein [bacterium]
MTALLLHMQRVDSLKQDHQVTHLIITQKWFDAHTFEQINSLSQKYTNVTTLDLSDLNLFKFDINKITSINTTFPETVRLILGRKSESAAKIIQQMVMGLKLLEDVSFTNPPSIPASPWGYLSPSSWGYGFWSAKESASTSSKQHHDTMRDLFDVSKISEGESNILSDWNRLDAGLVEINGHPIQTIVQLKNGEFFASLQALETFFKTELLSKLSEEQQSNAMQYVMKILHQGGLQNPVTAAVYYNCAQKTQLPQPVDARNKKAGIAGQYRVTSFKASDTGFIVHETLTQNRLVYNINAGDRAGEIVLPDEGSAYVFKAEARLKIDWRAASSKPVITIDKVGVSFGSSAAKLLFDDRWFYQKWIDNAGYYTGFNTVSDHSPQR